MTMIAIAFLLGFAGYLPLGNINTTVVQLKVTYSNNNWQRFIWFAAFMEFVYCFFSLLGINMLLKQTQLIIWLNWSAVIVFVALGVLSFYHSTSQINNANTGIKRGILIAIFNPLQIPFWMVWGVYVMQNGWLQQSWQPVFLFSVICSIGTVCILYLYAIAGTKMIEKLNLSGPALNRLIGVLFIGIAAYQLAKVW